MPSKGARFTHIESDNFGLSTFLRTGRGHIYLDITCVVGEISYALSLKSKYY